MATGAITSAPALDQLRRFERAAWRMYKTRRRERLGAELADLDRPSDSSAMRLKSAQSAEASALRAYNAAARSRQAAEEASAA